MEYQHFDCEILDGCAVIRWSGSGGPVMGDLCDEFVDLMLRLQEDRMVRCLLFTDGDHSFEFNHSLDGLAYARPRDEGFDILSADEEIARRIVTLMNELGKPVIAAARGDIRNLGLGFYLAADIRLSSAGASFTAQDMIAGMLPGWGLFHTLHRLMGPGRALDFLWSHRTIPADEAHRLGLVDRIIPDESWDEEIDAYVRRLASIPQPAVALSKLALQQAPDLDYTSMLSVEWESQQQCWASLETSEGLRAWQEGRTPDLGTVIDPDDE